MTKRKTSRKVQPEQKSFWTTLPGILTAVAGLITAITGLIAVLNPGGGLFAPKATPTSEVKIAEPPTFIPDVIFYSEEYPNPVVEQIEFDYKKGTLPDDTIQDFIRISTIEFGQLGSDAGGFNIKLIIRNTGKKDLALDLSDRFFSLVDDQGREAKMVYFCCNANGEVLSPGEERTVQMFFQSPPGWTGKSISANYILIQVKGLLPIVNLTWRLPTLAVAF